MASSIKVDIVRPTATNGSLSLKGDSGGSATTNGVTVDSSGNTAITGTTTVTALNVTANSASEAAVITQSGTGDALRITHDGVSGNALVVEDDANPDSTPVIIDQNGRLVAGYTSASPLLTQLNLGIQSIFPDSRGGFLGERWTNDDKGPVLLFAKSRSATIGTSTIVQNGDTLGVITFCGDDSNDLVTAGARIEAEVDGTPGTDVMPGRLVFSTTADGEGSPTERMRIDRMGRVGIGTTGTPSSKLHVVGDILIEDNSPVFNLKDSDSANATEFSGYIDFVDSTNTRAGYIGYGSGLNSDLTINNASNGNLDFRTNNTNRMRIDSSGNLKFDSGYGSVATAYGCRAWVNFDGTGTVAIRESGNVSSITDNGTGDYTVNFTTAMPDANYAAVFGTRDSNYVMVIKAASAVPTASSLRVATFSAYPAILTDREYNNVAIFR